MDEFLSLREVAELLKVDYKTVFNLVRTGQLPAGRVGNIYRVRRSDVDRFFDLQMGRGTEAATPAQPEGATPIQSCGACGILLKFPSMVGGACQHEECDALLCRRCWAREGRRECERHASVAPPSSHSLTDAVSAEEAAQREIQYIEGFELAVQDRPDVRSPIDGSRHLVTQWEAVHHEEPDLAETGSRVVGLHGSRSGPRNRTSCFHFRTQGHPLAAQSFALVAVVSSHVEAYRQHGSDNQAASLTELTQFITRALEKARAEDTVYVVGLAFPTGFTREAIDAIAGTQGKGGWSSLHLLLCLVDLSSEDVVYNARDERLSHYLELYKGWTARSQVRRVEDHVLAELQMWESQSLREVIRATGVAEATALKAFNNLVRRGGYETIRLPGTGTVIAKKR